MKKLFFFLTYFLLFSASYCVAQVQWASKVIDFSSEYKDDFIRENSTRWSATQVLGYPNTTKAVSSQLAWTPESQDGKKEFITVGFNTPQTVQQVIVGENYNAGSITEIILYDNAGKKYTVYENERPVPVQKMYDILTYFKIKPVYNVVKLKLVINTNAVFGRQEIDCIGISSTTAPYKHNVNVIKYTETVGQPENLGPNVNSQFYDHLPLISPDGSLIYFARKLTNENNTRDFDDDIYVAPVMPTGKFSKAENIGPPLNTSSANFICFISNDNNRLYVANKYIRNTYNYAGLSVSSKEKNGEWSKPKPLNIPNLYNKNEFTHYHMNMDENIALMAVQRDDSYGDLDLYVSQKYSDGDWSEPKNLGSVINTVGAEGSVFLAADGKTLYFSSSGHPGFGSYDMFMSKRLDDSWTNWSKPLNLGDKINTDEMDIYYTIPASGDYAYFSSGLTYFGKNDLYRIKLPKEARPEFVDIKKFVASAPLKKGTTVTSPITTQTTPAKKAEQPVKTITPVAAPVPVVASPPTVTTTPPKVATNPQTDDLQKKLDDLKKQQAQVATPVKPSSPAVQPVAVVTSKPQPTPTSTTAATPSPVIRKEVLNTIQPYQSPEELRTKPEPTNTIKPVELPKPAPKVLTQEELNAREQQKNNPTISPSSDRLSTLSKTSMPAPVPSAPVPQNFQNPNIVTNEVVPEQVMPVAAPPIAVNNAPLKTSSPQTDDLQKKLEDLKRQQTQITTQAPIIASNTQPNKSVREQYPNPAPIVTVSTSKSDDLQQKLDALKQQQREVGQSNKLYANPYEAKPYDPQPLKEKQEDNATQEYDDYQKKLDALKQQQKNVPTSVVNSPVVKDQPTQQAKVTPSPTTPITPTPSTSPSVSQQAQNPVIAKYEEKLRKLKEEMAAIQAPTNTVDTRLAPAEIPVKSAPSVIPESKVEQPAVVVYEPVVSEPKVKIETAQPKPTIISEIPVPEKNDVLPIATIKPEPTTEQELQMETAKLDSIQQAQKLAEQKLMETLDKMGSNKQELENDIADLKDQRTKFNDEKDKLTAQNTQLVGEKEKLEAEKKKMDDLLAQMQEERDKLAAEKLKIEQDKAKLDLLKKQQERDVLALKRSIDSLGKIQQKTASNVQAPQNFDLFNVPLKVGAVAQVNNIYFVADASFLQIPSYPELDKVVLFLARNNTLKVEIGGHTNGLCDDAYCQKLSTSRAKTCVDYLISKGIASDRLSYKGYGKTKLLKPEAPGNSLNQRVEIKILSVD
jgi:outer membrane protein OmpA-like peptidoglycan-associated protein